MLRRALWILAGLAMLAGVAALAALEPGGEPEAKNDPNWHFASRPDLVPPMLEVDERRDGTAPGLVFVAPKRKAGQSGPAIVDDHGEYVWFKPLPKGMIANDLAVQQYRGEPVLTWWEGRTNNRGYGAGSWVIADRSYREIARVQAGRGLRGDLHEFVLTDRGTALVTIYHTVKKNLRTVGSDPKGEAVDSIIQEIDVETGKVVWEWHSLDHVSITESYAGPPQKTVFPYDYFHINSIDVDPDGNLLVSARNTWAVYKINRKTGDVLWRLGGYRSDFALGKGVRFAWQHDARLQPDGTITVFDNQAMPQVGEQSRIVRIALDEARRTATATKILTHPDGILAIAEGNAQTLPGGQTFVGWGIGRRVSELGPDGKLLFDVRFPPDVDTYRAYRFQWEGRPAGGPDVAVTPDGVAASWNGATGITRWQVLAGPRPDELKLVAEHERTGFETTIPVRTPGPYVAVRALAGSRVLGTSRVGTL